MEPSSSPKNSLNTTDLWKVLRGALIIAAGAFSVEFLSQIANALTALDLGQFAVVKPLLVTALASLLEVTRRYFMDYSK